MTGVILDHLAKAEGIETHYNKGEKDITAPYGIYKYRHKDASIFEYLEEVAKLNGITKDTSEWTETDLFIINSTMESIKVRELAYEFYSEYLAGARLDDFPKECVVAYADMFTNSPKMAIKSIQEALIKLDLNPISNFDALSTIDGAYGSKTRGALLVVSDANEGLLLKSFMLSAMKSNYVRLVKRNPDKYFKYLEGWINRMDRLA
jgi:hypothetical protein